MKKLPPRCIFLWTRGFAYDSVNIVMSPLSTPKVARMVGIHIVTLERWIAAGKVKPSERIRVGSQTYRLWTTRDVERVKKYKAAHYWEGRGVKKKSKA